MGYGLYFSVQCCTEYFLFIFSGVNSFDVLYLSHHHAGAMQRWLDGCSIRNEQLTALKMLQLQKKKRKEDARFSPSCTGKPRSRKKILAYTGSF